MRLHSKHDTPSKPGQDHVNSVAEESSAAGTNFAAGTSSAAEKNFAIKPSIPTAPVPKNLIMVSNRLPFTIQAHESPTAPLSFEPSAGGLASSLRALHRDSQGLWVGHMGLYVDHPQFAAAAQRLESQNFLTVPLEESTYDQYYNGMSNGIIWPLCHYTTNVQPDPVDWQAYVHVNTLFANCIVDHAEKGAWVWVHDYQLMLVPRMLRERRPDLNIAYFHHIPFPSSEIFRMLPQRLDLLKGLLGCDLIGFHTADYERHFLTSVMRLLGHEVIMDEVIIQDRPVKVGVFPLGIDAEKFAEMPKLEHDQDGLETPSDQKLVLGVDRLDFTKGIPERLLAFERFLEQHPQQVGQVTMIQICVPSRTDIERYATLRDSVERIVGRINGRFAQPGYTPVQYLYRNFSFEQLVDLYRRAYVCMVTPIRDGLNLVCKEYVAARSDEDGVLILSEFAGASAEMGEALLVNPIDTESMAKALEQAWNMTPMERAERMRQLRKRILTHTNVAWSADILQSWQEQVDRRQQRSQFLEKRLEDQLLDDTGHAERIHLFIDYDGTLTPIVSHPSLAIPSEAILEVLTRLSALPQVDTTIVTGRDKAFCQEHFFHIPIDIVAEHGAFYRHKESKHWQQRASHEEFDELKPDILSYLERYCRCVPGSHIEEKDLSLVWHYRQSEAVFAKTQAMSLFESMTHLLGRTTYAVFSGKKNIEIRPITSTKGQAVESLLNKRRWHEDDLLLTLGDDTTDEDMYKVLPKHNTSIHVGKPSQYARFHMSSPNQVLRFLFRLVEKQQRNQPQSAHTQAKATPMQKEQLKVIHDMRV